MKKTSKKISRNFIQSLFRNLIIALIFCLSIQITFGQEAEKEKDTRPVRATFESVLLIDHQSVMVPIKGTFEFDMQHRFGVWKNGYEDIYGIMAPSNIRLGFNYVPIDKLSVGFGLNKVYKTWDGSLKYALLTQTRSGNIPLSMTYYGNMAINTRSNENIEKTIYRFSYFHQLIMARKFSRKFSFQISTSLAHFNAVDGIFDENKEAIPELNNDHFAISGGGAYKVAEAVSVIAYYTHPITQHSNESKQPKPNLSFGIEITSSSHAFQIFAGNYNLILPQRNHLYNQNDLGNGEFLIGFNITRLWNF